MNVNKVPQPKIVPFIVADALMLLVAGAIVYFSQWPLNLWQAALTAFAVFSGCAFLIIPFILEYKAAVKLQEGDKFVSTVEKIQKLEEVAKQITSATNYWQAAQAEAVKIIEAAEKIQQEVARQTREFSEFMARATDVEKASLRIEVQKLEQMHNDNVQVIMKLLDQVYALYRAALASGNQRIIEQISLFQINCRQIAEKIGLIAFDGKSGEKFDSQRHVNVDRSAATPKDAIVSGAIAPGYTYQTKMLRQALVSVQQTSPSSTPMEEKPAETANPAR
ncbi:MAG: nucleotide exchange factor GrpE, partial [Verrucomicrobiia bacterium]